MPNGIEDLCNLTVVWSMQTDILPLVKNSKFVSLWLSQLFSQLTIHILNFLLLYELYAKTGSSIATSLLWLFYALPAILIGPIASAYSDLTDRKKVLVLTNLLQSITIALYALIASKSFFLLYGVVLGYSLINQFYIPAEMATLPSVVSRVRLPQANGLFFLTQQSALIIGFGVAGFILSSLGFTNALYLCSFLLFLAFVSVLSLPKFPVTENIPRHFEKAFSTFFKRIIEGYVFIKAHREVLAPFLLLMCLQIALAIVAVNAPFFATELFAVPIEYIGILLIVPIGIGAFTSSLIIPKLLKSGYRKIYFITRSLELISSVLLLLAFLIPLLPFTSRLPAVIILLTLLGASFVGVIIPAQTFLQEKTPGGFRGRVFGNFWFLNTIATLFPVILSGALTELLGARFLIAALAFFFLGLLIFMKKYGSKFLQNGYKIK